MNQISYQNLILLSASVPKFKSNKEAEKEKEDANYFEKDNNYSSGKSTSGNLNAILGTAKNKDHEK